MLGLVRRFCSLLVHLLLKFTSFFRKSEVSSTPALPKSSPADDQWNTTEWDQGGDDWEPFTVQVVPNEPAQVQQDSACPEHTEADLFSDMQPVFKRPTMIRVAKKEERKEEVDLRKFSVQDENFEEQEEVGGGLGLWTDDVGGGWEDGVEQDVGDLVRDSREVLKKKRLQEREQRRLQQEKIRAQHKSSAQAHGLGTRVT